ncbi:energy transducer TonB [Hymenobacter busanensis]|uniref:Energy transducer TonB n=1 Tax=Hymenobacter busanensis TaxID=2607656 RepID=A0A7L5A2M7_9BACT|nr:energy transducer TonB [Hymenobacter busanensis]KAA9331548.1 energy transducer TonB [Hymenobacter busanensis]QHJ08702.1 TonB family protein [Hymenobacter busanensis]
MQTTNLQTASLDDIVFEGRNKEYGAYQLRQLYARHLQRALFIALSLCLLLLGGLFGVQYLKPEKMVVVPEIPLGDGVVLTQVVLPEIHQTAATAPVTVRSVRVEVPTHVIRDDKATTKNVVEERPTVVDDNELTTIGPATPGVANGPGGPGTAVAGPPTVVAPPAKPDIFISVEVMPEFVGGQPAMMEYLQKHLHYPRQALSNQIEGKVFVSFTVDATGAITDVEVLKGLGYGTDEEAARVIGSMPRWEPGRQNNRAVAVRYTLPISFHFAK